MAASYPSAAKSFTTKTTDETIEASHVNDLQDEVTAVETALLDGIAHDVKPSTSNARNLGSAALLWAKVYAATAWILGAETTDGVRVDLESGVMAVREGDDSAYAGVKALTVEATTTVTGAQYRTTSGTTGSIATATPTTIFTVAAAGKYEVFAFIPDVSTAMAGAVVYFDGTNARVTADNGAILTITLSGAAVQVTQTSGGNANVAWSSMKIR